MAPNLSPDQSKFIGELIEKKVLKTTDRSSIFLGVVLFLISLGTFLFSTLTSELGCATGYELIFTSHNLFAILFAILHLFASATLVIPRFPDKFQFATTAAIVNIPLFFIIMTSGARVDGTPCSEGMPAAVISFFALMVCWMNCGIKAQYRESQLMPFKIIGKLNVWIQEKYDRAQLKKK
jgi:hypothetical protein